MVEVRKSTARVKHMPRHPSPSRPRVRRSTFMSEQTTRCSDAPIAGSGGACSSDPMSHWARVRRAPDAGGSDARQAARWVAFHFGCEVGVLLGFGN